MQRGYFSVLIVVILAAAAFALLSVSSAGERAEAKTALDALRLERDYSLRAGLRDGMRDAMLFGAAEGRAAGGPPEEAAIARLREYAAFATAEYEKDGIVVSFWCAQAREDEFGNARKWAPSEPVFGYCWNASTPDVVRPAETSACGLLLSFDASRGRMAVTRGGGMWMSSGGELCAFPEISARSSEPSVFCAAVRYADGNWSSAVLPEGLGWE